MTPLGFLGWCVAIALGSTIAGAGIGLGITLARSAPSKRCIQDHAAGQPIMGPPPPLPSLDELSRRRKP